MPNESIRSIALKIKAYRQLLRLSQAFVGGVLGVDRTTYTRMENGKIEISAEDLRNLSNLFRVSPGDFLTPNLSLSSGPKGKKEEAFLLAGEFHPKNETAFTAIQQGARDLVLFASDPAARKYVGQRKKNSAKTSARFKTQEEAVRFCQKKRGGYLSGESLLIDKFIIEEFGPWISWNPLGPFACSYLEAGTAVTSALKLPLPLMVIHSEHSLERQRMSAAHALAHHLLGKKGRTGCPTLAGKDAAEKEADRFAKDLLMDPETVLDLFGSAKGGGLAQAARMTALKVQVSYLALVGQLATLGAVTPAEKRELLAVKARDFQGGRGAKAPQPFEDAYIRQDEAHLGKNNIYQTDPDCGGPKGPQDLRYLQESSYVEYLKTCKTRPHVELSAAFERVADYVRKKYPKYL